MNATGSEHDARSVLDPSVAERVSALSLRVDKAVEGLLSGIHRSPHRGASVVFVEHREYRPGDDPRLLDWKAFARTDRHVIKRFEHETQLIARLLLDRSASMDWRGWADAGPSKHEHAATLLAALALLLIRQGDAVGAATFGDAIGEEIPPRSRPAHLEAVFRTLVTPPEPKLRTNLRGALDFTFERAGRRGMVAIASDLLDSDAVSETDAFTPMAQLVARGHHVVVFHVLHPDEIHLPETGAARIVGLEGEAPIEIEGDAVRERYDAEMDAFIESCRQRCTAAGARYALARTDVPPQETLAALLRRR